MITDALIYKSTGQYDKEVMQRLRLEAQGLQRISNIDDCFNLMDLSLCRNEITTITGLNHLVLLKRLDLSFNKIRKIENLADLLSLEYLDLRANAISSVNDFEEIRMLSALHTLHLQSGDGEEGNPACRHPSYTTIVLRTLPQLQILDGGHLNITEAFGSLEEHLQRLQPDPADAATPPAQPWLDGLLTGSEETLQVPATEDDIDAALSTNKRFKEIGVAHTQISDMLSEECAHLLRKAQAATSKAASAAGSAK